MKLLLVEDSERLRTSLAKVLTRLGHSVSTAATAQEGDDFLRTGQYDAIVLDIMLPDQEGTTLLEKWRRRGDKTPVILLTALNAVPDRVRGLALGADDYLTKPFSIDELAARLEAVVRRAKGHADSSVRLGKLEIDFAARAVMLAGSPIILTAREFSLLECLARRPGRVFTREQIEAHLYNDENSPLSNAVDAAIYSLRRKISPEGSPQLIQTRRGLGYVIEPP